MLPGMSSLLATWLQSDIASTPNSWPSVRIISDSIPLWLADALDSGARHGLPVTGCSGPRVGAFARLRRCLALWRKTRALAPRGQGYAALHLF